MLYTTLKVNEKVFNLRITTGMAKQMKVDTGKTAYQLMQDMQDNFDIDPLLYIFLYACRWQRPAMIIDDVYTLYDEFIDMGYGMEQFTALIMEIFRVSGYAPTINKESADILGKMGIEVPADKIAEIEVEKSNKKK